jgi:hypothetical protein
MSARKRVYLVWRSRIVGWAWCAADADRAEYADLLNRVRAEAGPRHWRCDPPVDGDFEWVSELPGGGLGLVVD